MIEEIISTHLCPTTATFQHELFRDVHVTCDYKLDITKGTRVFRFSRLVLNDHQVLAPVRLMINTSDTDSDIIKVLHRFKAYCDIYLMGMLCSRLLRFSQCSKSLNNTVMNHPIWTNLKEYFQTFIAQLLYKQPFHVEAPPLSFLKSVYLDCDDKWNQLKSIINFRPPEAKKKEHVLTKRKRTTS